MSGEPQTLDPEDVLRNLEEQSIEQIEAAMAELQERARRIDEDIAHLEDEQDELDDQITELKFEIEERKQRDLRKLAEWNAMARGEVI